MSKLRLLSVVLSLTVVLGGFALPIMAVPPDGVLSTAVSGEGYVTELDGNPAVWQSESFNVTIEVADEVDSDTNPDSSKYYVRLLESSKEEYSPITDDAIAQQEVNLEELKAETVTLEVPADYFEEDGVIVLYASLYDKEPGSDSRVDQSAVPVHVLHKNRDFDDDDLLNIHEATGPTSISSSDTDGDDIPDGLEVHQFGTDPTSTDTDGDGLSDLEEIREHDTNPNQVDTDGDGLDDALEATELNTSPVISDTDGDGLSDAVEIEEYGTDPLKKDTDGDRLTDREEIMVLGTDPLSADSDNDGVSDALELRDSPRPTRSGSEEPVFQSQQDLEEQKEPDNKAGQAPSESKSVQSTTEDDPPSESGSVPAMDSEPAEPSTGADSGSGAINQNNQGEQTDLLSANILSAAFLKKLFMISGMMVILLLSFKWVRFP